MPLCSHKLQLFLWKLTDPFLFTFTLSTQTSAFFVKADWPISVHFHSFHTNFSFLCESWLPHFCSLSLFPHKLQLFVWKLTDPFLFTFTLSTQTSAFFVKADCPISVHFHSFHTNFSFFCESWLPHFCSLSLFPHKLQLFLWKLTAPFLFTFTLSTQTSAFFVKADCPISVHFHSFHTNFSFFCESWLTHFCSLSLFPHKLQLFLWKLTDPFLFTFTLSTQTSAFFVKADWPISVHFHSFHTNFSFFCEGWLSHFCSLSLIVKLYLFRTNFSSFNEACLSDCCSLTLFPYKLQFAQWRLSVSCSFIPLPHKLQFC